MPAIAFNDAVERITDVASGFDPRDAGTSEADWLELLIEAPAWTPGFQKLLVVSPHPDDETLGAGGLIHAAAISGCNVHVIAVTDGEAARQSQSDLATRRIKELHDSMSVLGDPADNIRITRLRIPDGQVLAHEDRVRLAVLAEAQPATLIVGPFELDGHPDHEATGRACRSAALSLNLPLARYPVWAWHWASVQALSGYEFRRFELDSHTQATKALALRAYRSQFNSDTHEAVVPPHVLRHFARSFEAFIL